MEFPKLTDEKTYRGRMTPEQDVYFKIVNYTPLDRNDEITLLAVHEFYKQTFKFLKDIKLSTITDNDAKEILAFLNSVFNVDIIPQNNIHFEHVFRVTNVRDSFLDDGKVRDVGFIKHPPKEVIEKLGVYGRANSPNSSVFYCAFEPAVAALESKPPVGQRIILAHWLNEGAKVFNSYPITNNKTIDNEGLKKATAAFQKQMNRNHPLFRAILDIYMEFLSSEYVKDDKVEHPKKYEYLISAFFADRTLRNSFTKTEHPHDMKPYDCIIYPSVAIQHKYENLAIHPDSVKKLRPYRLEDCIVTATNYVNPDISGDKLPFARQILRTATKFNGDKIIWDDDK